MLACISGCGGVIGCIVAAGGVLCAKKFALLGLMVGVSAKKFARRTKNGRKSVVCGVLDECQVPGFVETCLGRFLSCCCVLVFCLLWCDSAQGEVGAAGVVPVDPG